MKREKIWSSNIYVRIPRQEIGYFKFILESYENLCYMTVIDRFEAIIKISFVEEAWEEVALFLDALGNDIGLEIVYPPKGLQGIGYVSK